MYSGGWHIPIICVEYAGEEETNTGFLMKREGVQKRSYYRQHGFDSMRPSRPRRLGRHCIYFS